jgi:hypothetical protein
MLNPFLCILNLILKLDAILMQCFYGIRNQLNFSSESLQRGGYRIRFSGVAWDVRSVLGHMGIVALGEYFVEPLYGHQIALSGYSKNS